MKKLLLAITISLASAGFASSAIVTSQELGKTEPETAALARQLAKSYTVDGGLAKEILFQAITDDTSGARGDWREQTENFVNSEYGLLPSEESLLERMTKDWQNLVSAMTRLPYSTGMKKPLLWEVTAPDGGRHWIVATVHHPMNLSTLPQDSQLFDVVDKATIFMPEYFGLPALKERADKLKKMKRYDTAKKIERVIEMLECHFDNSLTNYGKRRGKRIVHLEEDAALVERQKRSASKLDAMTRQALLKGLSEAKKIKYYLDYSDLTFRSNQAFVDGNLAEMSKLVNEKFSLLSIGAYRSSVWDYAVVRNKRWVKVIEKTCKDKDGCLIYPGYGHVIEAEGSLISLLRERGFELRLIK